MSSFHFETQQNFDLKQQNFDFKQKHLPAPASPQPHYVILYRHAEMSLLVQSTIIRYLLGNIINLLIQKCTSSLI